MSSIYVFEIDGWGEVGPPTAVTASEGFADGTFTLTAVAPLPSDEIGAMCWVEDCDVVPDGFYTYTVKGSGLMTFQAALADVTVGTFTVTGIARVEDHYRISDGIPAWVTGAAAVARWYKDIKGVSDTAGQRISPLGGLASVDGVEIHATRRQGLAATSPETYRVAAAGPVTCSSPLSASSTAVEAFSAAPFSGESATTPTAAAQPPWFGLEAVDVRGVPTSSTADGVTTYTVTHDGSTTFVVRGVLRTSPQSHPQGAAIYGKIPTPVGQTCRTFVYPEGHAAHSSRSEKMLGLCERTNPSKNFATAQVFAIASQLLTPYRKSPGQTEGKSFGTDEPFSFITGTSSTIVRTQSGSQWNWILIDEHAALRAARTGSAPIEVDEDGFEDWQYQSLNQVDEIKDFPIVRRIDDRDAWMRLAFPSSMEFDGLGFPTGDIPRFTIARGTFNFYVIPPASGAPMCHVFEPVTWTRTANGDAFGGLSDSRLIQINPVDVILSVLTSTGSPSSNGAHDKAPREFGLAIPVSAIDSASFAAIGDRLDAQGINAGTVAILQEDIESLSDWLGQLAKTYGLAIATTTTGKVRLIDMAFVDFDTTVTLDEGDLVAGPATLAIDAKLALESVTFKYDRPWIDPDLAESQVTDTARAKPTGLTSLFQRIRGESVDFTPPFAASVDRDSQNALIGRWASIMGWNSGIVGTISADVDPGYSGEIGDDVAGTLPAFPNSPDTGAMSGAMCRIIDRVHVARPVGSNPRDTLTLIAYGVTSGESVRKWSPSGVVSAVTSATVFTLDASVYHGADYASDAASFTDGVKVNIWTANWALLSTVGPGTLSGKTGNQLTLSAAAQGGSGDVTAAIGNKVTLSEESDQSASDAVGWGWLSSSTPGYTWH